MGAIADYGDLLIAVQDYTGRDDFTHLFPRFVRLAEDRINRELRVGAIETEADITTASDGTATLPSDFMEARMVVDSSGYIMDSVTLTALNGLYSNTAGIGRAYTIVGSTFHVKPTQAATFTLSYYAKVDPLATAVGNTNTVLDEAPMIYLYAVALEVFRWAVISGRETDASKAGAMDQVLSREIANYSIQDERKRFSNHKVISRGVTP